MLPLETNDQVISRIALRVLNTQITRGDELGTEGQLISKWAKIEGLSHCTVEIRHKLQELQQAREAQIELNRRVFKKAAKRA